MRAGHTPALSSNRCVVHAHLPPLQAQLAAAGGLQQHAHDAAAPAAAQHSGLARSESAGVVLASEGSIVDVEEEREEEEEAGGQEEEPPTTSSGSEDEEQEEEEEEERAAPQERQPPAAPRAGGTCSARGRQPRKVSGPGAQRQCGGASCNACLRACSGCCLSCCLYGHPRQPHLVSCGTGSSEAARGCTAYHLQFLRGRGRPGRTAVSRAKPGLALLTPDGRLKYYHRCAACSARLVMKPVTPHLGPAESKACCPGACTQRHKL